MTHLPSNSVSLTTSPWLCGLTASRLIIASLAWRTAREFIGRPVYITRLNARWAGLLSLAHEGWLCICKQITTSRLQTSTDKRYTGL
jgi:hypothetical protein